MIEDKEALDNIAALHQIKDLKVGQALEVHHIDAIEHLLHEALEGVRNMRKMRVERTPPQGLSGPNELLRHHVTGAIERGEKTPIVSVDDESNEVPF